MGKRYLFVVRWKPYTGRDGGLGPVKSFKTTARNPNEAAQKLKSNGRVVSVRKKCESD